ncbi:hypothetical protein KR222_007093 [Zaprionus bogoriensis]|nr:hypothetical protein KR222_007093 [Zaprionus bogoriensis]
MPRKIGGVQFEKIGNNFYYIATNQRVSWFEARERCAALESHLASFQNAEEFNAIVPRLTARIDYWIDFTNLADQSEFVSVVTGSKPLFVTWMDGEPNNQKSEQCGMVYYRRNKHLMNTDICEKKWAFICEYPY